MFKHVQNKQNFLQIFLHFINMKNIIILTISTTFLQIIRAHDEDDEFI